jgi:hypothetical protein
MCSLRGYVLGGWVADWHCLLAMNWGVCRGKVVEAGESIDDPSGGRANDRDFSRLSESIIDLHNA